MAASKKKATKKKAPARRGSTAIATSDWEKALEQHATEDKARTASTEGNTISIRGGSFKYQGQDVGDQIHLIVVDFAHLSNWYDRPYDPDDLGVPACAAFSYKGESMAPAEDSPLIQTEDGTCANCWAHEWGSGSGRSRACRDYRNLLVLDPAGDIESDEFAVLMVPPTSLKKFDGYISSLSRLGKPCYAVVTTFDFDADEDYPVLVPSVKENTEKALGKAQLSALLKRRAEATEQLLKREEKPFDFSQFEPFEEKPKGRRGAASKKKATPKKKAGGRSKFS